MKKKIINTIIMIIIFLLGIVLAFSLYKIVLWGIDNYNSNNVKEKTTEVSNLKEKSTGKNVGKPKSKFDPYWDFIKYSLIEVDFDKLNKMNSDTVAWVNMKKSKINYPVVQTSNNSFYLNHDFYKKYNEAGWVFMDYRNNSNFDNKNTVIYAHSRVDGSMFHTLRNAVKEKWFKNKNNRVIRISTPKENSLWLVFSSYTIEAENYYIKTDFIDNNDYSNFINKIKSRSFFDYNTEVNTSDRILTLSSCYTADGIRVAVHAKLIKQEERN